MTANPADAVREAHISLVRVKASRLAIQHADDLIAIEGGIDALHNRIADLTTELAKAKHDRLAALAGAGPVAWIVTCRSDDDCDSSDDYSQYVSDFAFVELLQSHGVVKSVTPLFTHAPAKAREDAIRALLLADDSDGPEWNYAIRAALATFAEGA